MMHEIKIRLAGIDLDGTLLRQDKTISRRTAVSLKSAAGRGVYIVPVTGRPLSGIPKCVSDLSVCDFVITTNGAVITDLKTGRRIYSAPIEHEKTVSLMQMLDESGISYEAFANGSGYLKPDLMARYDERYGGSPIGEYIRASRKVTADPLRTFIKEKKSADEIFVSCKSSRERSAIAETLRTDSDIQLCFLEDAFLEITRRGTDKGTAFEFLCEYLGISRQNTAAFGDNANDLALLDAAGLSVAMGNAPDSVRQRADLITDTNENDGVAKVLDCF